MPRSASSFAPRVSTLVIFAAGLLASTTSNAADTTLRLHGQVVSSSATAVGLTSDFGSGPGAYLGAEFHLNDRFGIEVGVAWFELEESERLDALFVSTDATASLTVAPLTVALNVHLTPQKRYDFYVAPKIGWAFFDDLEISTRIDFGPLPFPGFPTLPIIPGFGDSFVTPFSTKDQFIFGLRLGFDVPFGDSSWSFSSSIDYTDMDLEIDTFFAPAPAVGLDPVSVGAGVAYHF